MHWFLNIFCFLGFCFFALFLILSNFSAFFLGEKNFQILENELNLPTDIGFFWVHDTIDDEPGHKVQESDHKLIRILLFFVSLGLDSEEFDDFVESLEDLWFEFKLS